MILGPLLLTAAAAAFRFAPPPPVPLDTVDATAAAAGTTAPELQVRVDSANSRIIITAGPFQLHNMPAGMGHMEHDMGMERLMRFEWPVDGWMRGFNVEVHDGAGKPLPAKLVHHLIGVNFDRRQLVYPALERLFGWGAETDPVELPKSLGVPLERGEKLGMYMMWHNDVGHDIRDAYLKVTLLYTPRAGNHVTSVLPLYVDVNNVIGGRTDFDLPPGKSSQSYEFELPVGVRLIGVGGHLHDYGTSVRLEDAESGKVLVRLKAKRDDAGHVSGVGRFIFGFNADALHLEAHHRYRVVGEYDNPTGKTIVDGGMAHINGAIVPDDMSKWPRLDPNDPMIQKDIATLPHAMDMKSGAAHAHPGTPADHMEMNHGAHTGHPMPMKARPDSVKRP